MELGFVILLLLLLNYVIFIGLLTYGFNKVKCFKINNLEPKTRFSIIVSFKNAENNIADLLASISKLNYPKELFDIIFIDDFSNDNSVSIYNKWRIQNGLIQSTLLENLRLSNSQKNDAMTRAIPIVKYEWIITTDTNCVLQPNWLVSYDNYIQTNNCEMLISAVSCAKSNLFLNYFQYLNVLIVQAITIGSFGLNETFRCNGANFAYTKKLFLALKGFNGNTNLVHEADVFLLQKAVKHDSKKVHYLKSAEAIVYLKPEKSMAKFFSNCAQLATKTSAYNTDFSTSLMAIVLLTNIGLVAGFGITLLSDFGFSFLGNMSLTQLTPNAKRCIIAAVCMKFLLDYVLLQKTNNFTAKSNFLLPFLSILLYPFYIAIAGICIFFAKIISKSTDFKK